MHQVLHAPAVDDAGLVERLGASAGVRVATVAGDALAFKITTAADHARAVTELAANPQEVR